MTSPNAYFYQNDLHFSAQYGHNKLHFIQTETSLEVALLALGFVD